MHTASVADLLVAAAVVAALAGVSTCLDRQRLLAARVERIGRAVSIHIYILLYQVATWRETPIASRAGVRMRRNTCLSDNLPSQGHQLGEDGQHTEPTLRYMRGRTPDGPTPCFRQTFVFCIFGRRQIGMYTDRSF